MAELLVEAAGRLARTTTTPMLWIYTENDSFFAPALAAAMYAAYTQNGGKGEFEHLGPFGQDGHRLFFGAGGSQIWGPMVARYLASRIEASSKTMEAERVPGLYFIGEVVDVTGHLGGHNFQWAWSSGFAAGQFA